MQSHLHNTQMISKLIKLAAPSLLATGKPEPFLLGLYTRLQLLINIARQTPMQFMQMAVYTYNALGFTREEEKNEFNSLIFKIAYSGQNEHGFQSAINY